MAQLEQGMYTALIQPDRWLPIMIYVLAIMLMFKIVRLNHSAPPSYASLGLSVLTSVSSRSRSRGMDVLCRIVAVFTCISWLSKSVEQDERQHSCGAQHDKAKLI